MARLVVVPERLEHLGLFEVEAEGAHGDFELVVVQRAVLVRVEELEGFFDLLLLFVGELGARVGVGGGGGCCGCGCVRAAFGFGGGAGGVHLGMGDGGWGMGRSGERGR